MNPVTEDLMDEVRLSMKHLADLKILRTIGTGSGKKDGAFGDIASFGDPAQIVRTINGDLIAARPGRSDGGAGKAESQSRDGECFINLGGGLLNGRVPGHGVTRDRNGSAKGMFLLETASAT